MKMRIQRVAVAAVIGLALLGAGPAQAAGYRMPITFAGYTNRTEVLTSFPVLVVLSNNVGNSCFSFSAMPFLSTNGWDLRFQDATETTNLNYEIEKWNTNAASFVWVQVPEIRSNGTSHIWAKWADSANSNQLTCTTNGTTWTNGFAGVWHMNGGAADSTTNKINGTVSLVTSTQGYVAGAEGFVSSAYMSVSATRMSGPAGTVELLIRQDDSNISDPASYPSQMLFTNPDGANRLYLYLASNSMLQARCKTSNLIDPNRALGTLGTWNHVALSWTSSASKLYRNGEQIGTGVLDSAVAFQPSVYIGSYSTGRPDGFRGLIDETRVSTGVRSSNWVWACWLNQASNTAFNAYGTAVAPGGDGLAIASATATNVTTTTACLNGLLVSTGMSATAVYVFWGPGSDQGTNTPSTWANTNFFGTNDVTIPPSRAYTTNVISLTPGTAYSYRYYAVNGTGGVWGAAQRFTTYIEPLVNNTAGAVVLTPTKAWLQGAVTQGEPPPHAYFCLDTSDKGTTSTGNWSRVISAGAQSGAFSNLVTGLLPNTSYSYRCYATNAVADAWAASAATFNTPARDTVFCLTNNQDRTDGQSLSGTNGPGGTAATVADTGGSGLLYDFSYYLGLDMGGYRIQANAASLNLTLDMADAKGAITNGGDISTSMNGANTGSITITNAGSISVGKITTDVQITGNGGAAAGSVSISHSGSLIVDSTSTHGHQPGSGGAGNQSFAGDGTGAFTLANTNVSVNSRATQYNSVPSGNGGAVTIRGYAPVSIAGEISSYGQGGSPGGAVTIGAAGTPIGGNVTIGKITTASGQTGYGGAVSLYANGAISVGDIVTGANKPDVSGSTVAGAVTVVSRGVFTAGVIRAWSRYTGTPAPGMISLNGTDGSGACTVTSLSTDRMAYPGVYTTPSITISNFYAIAVNGDVRADYYPNQDSSPGNGGNITMSCGSGGIVIKGVVSANAYSTGADGPLSLTSSGEITPASLDLSKVQYAVVSPGWKCIVKGDLVGFSTNVESQTQLRMPVGKRMIYYPGLTNNAYLVSGKYVLASPDGTPAAGGVLMPYASPGTVVTLK